MNPNLFYFEQLFGRLLFLVKPSLIFLFLFYWLQGSCQILEVTTTISNNSICAGEGFSISSQVSSKPGCIYSITYEWQWRFNPGDDFTKIDDPVIFANVDSSTVVAENVPSLYNGIEIRLHASGQMPEGDNCIPSAAKDSEPKTITVMDTDPLSALTGITISPANGSICLNEGSYVLTAQPGSNPTQISWYNGDPTSPSNSTKLGSGVSISVSSSGTYYARREKGECSFSSATNLMVVYGIPSTAFTAATANPQNVCAGSNTTLTATGGTDGTGAVTKWYTMQNGGGTSIGTGASITVSPTVTTTYYVRREGTCGNPTADRSVVVTVKAVPAALTGIQQSTTNPCEGNAITLTASGGSTQSGETIVWYDGPNGTGTKLGMGSTLPIPNAVAKTYYVRRENGCPGGNSADFSTTVTTRPAPVAAFNNFPTGACVNIPVTFPAVTAQSGVTFTWTFSGGTPSSFTGPGPVNVTYSTTGNKTVTLKADNGSCSNTVTQPVVVTTSPDIKVNNVSIVNSNLTLSVPEKIASSFALTSNLPDAQFTWTCIEESGNLSGNPGSGSGDNITNKWVLADGETQASLLCTVDVTAGSCTNTDDFHINVKRLLFIPNVITANGDGFNECWAIKLESNSGFSPADFKIELYDRRGKCVMGCDKDFTIADAVEWCGEGCAADPYFYIIKGPEGFVTKGALTLVK